MKVSVYRILGTTALFALAFGLAHAAGEVPVVTPVIITVPVPVIPPIIIDPSKASPGSLICNGTVCVPVK